MTDDALVVELPRTLRKKTFTGLCEAISGRLARLETTIVGETLKVADMLRDAKMLYEHETATGHGKRNPSRVTPFVRAAAVEVGRSPAFIQRLLQLSEIDPATRFVLTKCADVSQATLLAVAREKNVGKRKQAATALVEGGRAAVDAVVGRGKKGKGVAAADAVQSLHRRYLALMTEEQKRFLELLQA